MKINMNIFSEATLDKNLFNGEKLGSLDLQTNLKIRNYKQINSKNFWLMILTGVYRLKISHWD